MAVVWNLVKVFFSFFLLCFANSLDDKDSQTWDEGEINRFGIAEPELEVRISNDALPNV